LDLKEGLSPGWAERVVKLKQESRVSNYGFQAHRVTFKDVVWLDDFVFYFNWDIKALSNWLC
jgi:hypothetical protein